MEQISKTLGLHHIAEDIFKLLDEKTIIDCRLVNNSWKNILDQPMFWLKKLQKLSKIMPENFHYQSWKSLSQELDDDDPILENEFALILSKIYMRKRALFGEDFLFDARYLQVFSQQKIICHEVVNY